MEGSKKEEIRWAGIPRRIPRLRRQPRRESATVGLQSDVDERLHIGGGEHEVHGGCLQARLWAGGQSEVQGKEQWEVAAPESMQPLRLLPLTERMRREDTEAESD